MKFTVHTSRSEAVCTTSGGKMISYTHDKFSWLHTGEPDYFPVVSGQRSDAERRDLRILSEKGFADAQEFTPVLQMPEKVAFTLEDNTATHNISPCLFKLTHTYTVNDSGFSAKYTFHNRDKCPVSYRLDSDPIFRIPLAEKASPDEYRLEISAVNAVLTAENGADDKIVDCAVLDGSKDNIIRLADIASDVTTLVLDEHLEKQIRLFSEKTGRGLQIDLVGFRSLTVKLYKNKEDSHICLKILNYVPDCYAEKAAGGRRNSVPCVPAGDEYTVGYVVTIL